MENIDNKVPVDCIYTDFAQDFDKVNHEFIISQIKILSTERSINKCFPHIILNYEPKLFLIKEKPRTRF